MQDKQRLQAAEKGSAESEPSKVGFVSLGCPKALVDSERILTQLKVDGYDVVPSYSDADVVVVNTCGFIDSAKQESLDAIGEAVSENGKVIVTGCMGVEDEKIRELHPQVLAVTGPQQYEQVVSAVHQAVPISRKANPFLDLVPQGVKLTPRHYAYLKISEGCNHRCRFCIIPSMRGDLVSRPIGEVLDEAERLVNAGTKELLVVSQDTSAYGIDTKFRTGFWQGKPVRSHITELARELGGLGAWVRLHYVYPYPHVSELLPLMAEGLVLPYLDIPFQHASPSVLKAMRRPAHQEKTLQRIAEWRNICPELSLRSTFIVGFPGETEADFNFLLDWLDEAQLDRVGCFEYSPVEGAAANDLDNPVADDVKHDRWQRFMEKQQAISAAKLKKKIGKDLEVIVDGFDDQDQMLCRSKADAPEIDGQVIVTGDEMDQYQAGDLLKVRITESDDYDLFAETAK